MQAHTIVYASHETSTSYRHGPILISCHILCQWIDIVLSAHLNLKEKQTNRKNFTVSSTYFAVLDPCCD